MTFSWGVCGLGAVCGFVSGCTGNRVASKYRPNGTKQRRKLADIQTLRKVKAGAVGGVIVWMVAYWLVAGELFMGLLMEAGW